MQKEVQQWIKASVALKKGLETWVETVNQKDLETLTALYHSKARVFPTFGSLKVGQSEISDYLANAQNTSVKLNYGSITYNTEENMAEGQYTFSRPDKADVQAKFAFKFDSKGLIVEHASAPLATKTWHLKSEVSVCTLLTAATVKSVLKDSEPVTEKNSFFSQLKKASSTQ